MTNRTTTKFHHKHQCCSYLAKARALLAILSMAGRAQFLLSPLGEVLWMLHVQTIIVWLSMVLAPVVDKDLRL